MKAHFPERSHITFTTIVPQKETAKKRYEDLLKNQAALLQLIPLNYLSSYLGITQRHLSRIRKSLSN